MDEKDTIDRFSNAVDTLVNRFLDEYDLTYAAIVGALQMRALMTMAGAIAIEFNGSDRKDHVSQDLDKLVRSFRNTYAISDAVIVGTLNMKAFLLMTEAQDAKEPQ